MVGLHTKVNFAYDAFFTKSHVNTVVIYTLKRLKMHFKKMKQHFQYMAPKVIYDNNSDSFAAHLEKYLHKN